MLIVVLSLSRSRVVLSVSLGASVSCGIDGAAILDETLHQIMARNQISQSFRRLGEE